MQYEIECSSCHRPSSNILNYKCSFCGQPLVTQVRLDFEAERIRRGEYTVWRYARFFPYVNNTDIISLGEGWTPLVRFADNIHFKLENLNPTGSFKDRGSTVLISALHKWVERVQGYISEDSSGNAGASIAAYAIRAGLRAKIYIPGNVSGPKFNQIQFYGAEVVKVSGDRNRVAGEAQKAERGKFYVGHILHPMFRDGMRSIGYEIVEQLGWRVPEHIYLPVSAGTLLLGLMKGLNHLVESNTIETMPRVVACQTNQVSPLYHGFKNLSYTPPEKVTSVADALVSVNPPLLNLMVRNLKHSNGDAVIVSEDEIFNAFVELARKGFYVEPSSAVAYAAFKKQLMAKEISNNDKAVVILTGTGLKTTLNRAL